ncbi:MAG: DUF559 domain-containing protein [Actinomycetes bacterium]
MPRVTHRLRTSEFVELNETQSQVVSRAQLAAFGVGRQLIARRLDADRWQAIGPHVVVLHSGPLSREQQYWAGVLHAGPDAVLAGLTALEVEGFTGFRSPDVVTCVPHGQGRRDLVTMWITVRVHESRHLPDAAVHRQRHPPRTHQDRSAVDAASGARSDLACRTILAMTVQQRLVTPSMLRAVVLPRANLPRRGLILETLDDIAGGSQSLPELQYLAGVRRFGLPEPTRQRIVRREDGTYYLDADYDLWLVTVEINGVQHLTLRQKEYDDLRRTRLAMRGRLMVDIGSYTVRHDIVLAVLLTADALLSRGWVPDPKVLRRLLKAAEAHAEFTWTTPIAA